MSRRVYLSGAEKRKKTAKMNEVISSVPQLTSFFTPSHSQSNSSTSRQQEELVETDERDIAMIGHEDEYPEIAQPEPEDASSSLMGDTDPINVDPISDVIVVFDDPAEWTVDDKLHEWLVSRPIQQNI